LPESVCCDKLAAGGDATFNGVEAESGWLEQDVNIVAEQ